MMDDKRVNQMTALLELTHDAVCVWRLDDGVVSYWNAAAEQLFGFSAGDALGKPIDRLLRTGYPGTLDDLKAVLRRDHRWQGLLLHTHKSGQQIHADSRLVCDSAADGEQLVLQTSLDVTAQVAAEQALRVSEERFRSLVMATAQAVIVCNAEGQAEEESASWRAFTGQTFEQAQGQGWSDALHPEDRERITTRWAQSVATATPYSAECRVRQANGDYRWVAVRGVPRNNSDGQVCEWVVGLSDINDKKRAAQAIRDSEERLHYALEAGSMVAWDLNLTTGFTKRSGPAKVLFGLQDGPAEEFLALVHPDDQAGLRAALNEVKNGHGQLDREFRVTVPDGGSRWVAAKAQRRFGQEDGQAYVTGVVMDITRRRQAKDRLKLLDAVTEATRAMSDPLQIIAAASRLLGGHFSASRCLYTELAEGADRLLVCHEWRATGVSACADSYPVELLGAGALANIRTGEALVVRDADRQLTPAGGQALFQALGVKAAICCRLLEEGPQVSMVGVFQQGPRDWSDADIALVEEVVERAWGHVERARAREALRRSEAHLSSLLEQTAVGILESDLSGRVIRVNDQCCRILGRSRDEVLGREMGHFTHPGDLARNLELFEQAVKSGRPFEIEKRYLRPDGSQVWVNNTVSLINPGGSGSEPTLLAIVIDITERKQAEAKLVETSSRLQFTLESAEIGNWDLDLENDLAQRSLRHDQCFGYDTPIPHWGFKEFIQHVHPEDRDLVSRQFEIAVNETQKKWHFECRVIWPDASVHWIAAHGNLYQVDGKPTKMGGIVFDITERKGHEQALRASEQQALAAARQAEDERRRLDAVLEAVPVGIAVINAEGHLHLVNPAHQLLWGEPSSRSNAARDYHLRKGWWADGSERHGTPLQPQDWAAARTLRGETTAPDIIEIESFDEPPVRRIIMVSSAPILDSSGRISGVATAQMDISDRVTAEKALRESDRRKDEFLAMLAHELRNPLAPIGAAADLLRLGHLEGARVKQASDIISRQVRHMTSLVDDLLDVSRVTRGLVALNRVKLDAKRVVNDAIEQVRPLIEARGHSLTLHTPPESAYVCADQKRLVQVVSNLLNNAAKYTPEGGEISLSVEVDGRHVKMTVADNGMGMEPELLGRVFELFAQAERSVDRSLGGLGIGLALVRSLVELHGGSVQAYSDGPGCGTRLTVCLPQLHEEAAPPQAIPSEAAPATPQRVLKVLVVDDNHDAAQMLAMYVEALGHQTLVEHNSRKALERARQQKPDVCLLDIGLPDMDGNELARRLRSQSETAEAVLVAVTGYGQEQDKRAATEAGFDHHFVKPLDAPRLTRLLEDTAAQG